MNHERDRLVRELTATIGALSTERVMPLIDDAMKTYIERVLEEAGVEIGCEHLQDSSGKCRRSGCPNSLPS